jgi:hypothetical protein
MLASGAVAHVYGGPGGSLQLLDESYLAARNKSEEKKIKGNSALLLKVLPADGSRLSNLAARKKSGLSEDDYFAAKAYLISEEKAVTGRGPGGSIARVVSERAEKGGQPKEQDLYPPVKDALLGWWNRENEINNFLCETIANREKKNRGRWTVPDLIIASIESYEYIPGKTFTLYSFEVKTEENVDVASVFQTAAHKAFAHKCFLIVGLAKNPSDSSQERMDVVAEKCKLFGVGLMSFEYPKPIETLEVIVEPKRESPDSKDVNDFLKRVLSESSKALLRSMK